MKNFFLVILVLFLSINISSEIKYKVSGIVTRNGIAYDGAMIKLSIWKLYKSKNNSSNNSFSFKTSKDGKFWFYLFPGEYYLNCNYISPLKGEIWGLRAEGPKKIIVKEKNISALKVVLYKTPEAIQANLNILEEIPTTISTVNYKWGRIPIFSEDRCRSEALIALSSELVDGNNSILQGAQIGTPIIFYDLQNNPIFYQYPVVNLNVEIGTIDVAAIGGDRPNLLDYGFLDLTLDELKNNRNQFKGIKGGIHALEQEALTKFSDYKGYNIEDLEISKYICLNPSSNGLSLLVKNISINKSYIINPLFHTIKGSDDDFQQLQDFYETKTTFFYIQSIVYKNGYSLIKK